jgi:hypothetical protein
MIEATLSTTALAALAAWMRHAPDGRAALLDGADEIALEPGFVR